MFILQSLKECSLLQSLNLTNVSLEEIHHNEYEQHLVQVLNSTKMNELILTNTKKHLTQGILEAISKSTITRLELNGIAGYPGFEDQLGKTLADRAAAKNAI